MRHYTVIPKGMKRTFTICKVGSNPDLADRSSIDAYLQSHYATYNNRVQWLILTGNYQIVET
jgi:hypothetical protein